MNLVLNAKQSEFLSWQITFGGGPKNNALTVRSEEVYSFEETGQCIATPGLNRVPYRRLRHSQLCIEILTIRKRAVNCHGVVTSEVNFNDLGPHTLYLD
jgi:hypothetical protein